MATVTRTIFNIMVGDDLSSAKVRARPQELEDYDNEGGTVGEAQVTLTCANGTLLLSFGKPTTGPSYVAAYRNNSYVGEIEAAEYMPYQTINLSSYALGKITSIAYSGTDINTVFEGWPLFEISEVDPYGNRLYTILDGIIKKLKKINTRLDYCLALASTKINPTYTTTAGVSGITVSGSNVVLYGNNLWLYAHLTLSSAAQTTIGTGSITPKLILTYTFSNFVLSTSSSDNTVNLNRIYSSTPTGTNAQIAFPSGGGNCPVVAHYAETSISGSTLTVKIYVKAVKAKGAAWYLRVHIPVVRAKPTI